MWGDAGEFGLVLDRAGRQQQFSSGWVSDSFEMIGEEHSDPLDTEQAHVAEAGGTRLVDEAGWAMEVRRRESLRIRAVPERPEVGSRDVATERSESGVRRGVDGRSQSRLRPRARPPAGSL